MKRTYIILSLLCFVVSLKAVDSTKVKKGWTFGALPTVTYNSDLGLQYGGLVNFYNYGDGSRYPNYNHSIYLEISRYTKGTGINKFYYDSDQLIRGVRFTTEFSFLTEKALDFYGFNGVKAVYNSDWEDNDVKSRVFYRHDRRMLFFRTDFVINTKSPVFKIYAGISSYGIKVGAVDIDKLNKGKDEDEKLPDVKGLYELYTDWELINENEKDGGNQVLFKGGLVADTRDNLANPMKGLWSELLFIHSPKNLFNSENSFTMLSCTHREYFTLIKRDLSFAYRIGYQMPLKGNVPFYMLPIIHTSSSSYEGVGGSRSVRGILRNRVVGKSLLYWNMELRWKFYYVQVFNQNLYIALNTFLDGGKVVEEVKLDKLDDLKKRQDIAYDDYFSDSSDPAHIAVGAGIRFVLNENFIVACDYGIPTQKEDGNP